MADFESRGGGKRVEYLTWIFTPHSRVQFFATMSVDQLAMLQSEFEGIVRSTILP